MDCGFGHQKGEAKGQASISLKFKHVVLQRYALSLRS